MASPWHRIGPYRNCPLGAVSGPEVASQSPGGNAEEGAAGSDEGEMDAALGGVETAQPYDLDQT